MHVMELPKRLRGYVINTRLVDGRLYHKMKKTKIHFMTPTTGHERSKVKNENVFAAFLLEWTFLF